MTKQPAQTLDVVGTTGGKATVTAYLPTRDGGTFVRSVETPFRPVSELPGSPPAATPGLDPRGEEDGVHLEPEEFAAITARLQRLDAAERAWAEYEGSRLTGGVMPEGTMPKLVFTLGGILGAARKTPPPRRRDLRTQLGRSRRAIEANLPRFRTCCALAALLFAIPAFVAPATAQPPAEILDGIAARHTEQRAPRPAWSRHGCRDTRAEVIAARCSDVRWDALGCHVRAATCRDRYAGTEISTDTAPQSLQVDHRLPWRWLGKVTADWPAKQRVELYNDPGNLEVVRSRTNGRKNGAMPSEWCPLDPAARPDQAAAIRATVALWRLPLPQEDRRALALWDRGLCSPGARRAP